jgi:hypothetical protein
VVLWRRNHAGLGLGGRRSTSRTAALRLARGWLTCGLYSQSAATGHSASMPWYGDRRRLVRMGAGEGPLGNTRRRYSAARAPRRRLAFRGGRREGDRRPTSRGSRTGPARTSRRRSAHCAERATGPSRQGARRAGAL